MGLGNLGINVLWKLVVVAVYAALYALTPLRLSAGDWWVWVLLFFADDLSYYWFHRVSHECRLFWASHVVHHSSQHYNLSTALRQTWVPMTYLPFWLWLPLVGLRAVDDPAGPELEPDLSVLPAHRARRPAARGRSSACSTRPSHHRVHHGANEAVPRPQLRRDPDRLGPAVRLASRPRASASATG